MKRAHIYIGLMASIPGSFAPYTMHLPKHLSSERLKWILGHYAGQKIGVVGDLGLDAYWHVDMTRSCLSRETPRYPRPVVREVYGPGAGANVADNLKALGVGQVVVFSVLGDDWRGKILRREMSRRGIVVERLIVSLQRSTTTFIKPILTGYDSQQEDARLDFENTEALTPALEEALIERVSRHLPDLDALLIADQLDVHGVITNKVREALNRLAADYPAKCFVVDSRRWIGLFENMTLKVNRGEAVTAVHPDRDPHTVSRNELAQMAQTLNQQNSHPVFITLGEEGVLVCAGGEHHHIPATPTRPPLDIVGAGDTFIAALGATLAVGATPWEAGAIGNLAAAVTVEKLNQTGTAAPGEILKRYRLEM